MTTWRDVTPEHLHDLFDVADLDKPCVSAEELARRQQAIARQRLRNAAALLQRQYSKEAALHLARLVLELTDV